jgi:acetyltransferase-like isoleucine patch superfamily enzyme
MNWPKVILDSLHKQLLCYAGAERRVEYFRRQGAKIGTNCTLCTMSFSTEPYLIEIGNHVAIAEGVEFVTHDGSVCCFGREVNGGIFGKIIIGNNTFIGIRCIILCNTIIGNNCIVGAGSVLRGRFPDNSVIAGNPAKVLSTMDMQKAYFQHNPGLVQTNNVTAEVAHERVKEHFRIARPRSRTNGG